MCIRYYFKNKLYKFSNRNYLCDYSKIEPRKIDMTLSGRYLYSYPSLNISVHELDKYPNLKDIKQLEKSIKNKIVPECEIIIGSGVNGLLQNIIKILYIKKGNLVTPFYTFDQAEFAVTSFMGKTKRVYTKKYNLDIKSIIKSVDKRTKMVYICNPNHSTGKFIKSQELIDLSLKLNVPLIIDESGIEFTKQKSILEISKKIPDNLIVLRSFSKAYGLANVRIGYLACSLSFKEKYLKSITTNEVSGFSYLIATKMLENSNDYMKNNVENILNEKKRIIAELEKLGINILDSFSNTIFTKTYFDLKFLSELNKNNVSVVPVYDKNNNIHIRIAVQEKETNNKFIKVMKKILKNKELVLGVFEDN